MSGVTLPGTTEGLLRRCSPCRVRRDPDDEHFQDVPLDYGVVLAEPSLSPSGDVVPSVWMTLDSHFPDEPDIADCWLHLDLTEATGRAHAAWWLAERVKNWPDEPDFTTAMWRRWITGPQHKRRREWGLAPGHYWPDTFSAFAGLEPSIVRRLPDGSRWVDAEALRLVCLHVAGREAAEAGR